MRPGIALFGKVDRFHPRRRSTVRTTESEGVVGPEPDRITVEGRGSPDGRFARLQGCRIDDTGHGPARSRGALSVTYSPDRRVVRTQSAHRSEDDAGISGALTPDLS